MFNLSEKFTSRCVANAFQCWDVTNVLEEMKGKIIVAVWASSALWHYFILVVGID